MYVEFELCQEYHGSGTTRVTVRLGSTEAIMPYSNTNSRSNQARTVIYTTRNTWTVLASYEDVIAKLKAASPLPTEITANEI